MAQTPVKLKKTQKDILEQLRKLWEKDRKTLIQKVALVGGFFLVVFAILVPMFFKISSMQAEEKEMIATLATAQSKVKRMPQLKIEMETLQKELADAKTGFLQIRDLDQLLSELSKLAEKSKVRIVGSRPVESKFDLPAPYNQQYLLAAYELTAESGYHNFGKFINDIETYNKWLLIREMSIQSAKGGAAQKLQCTFQIIAFVQVPKKV